jgi:AbiJ-like protein
MTSKKVEARARLDALREQIADAIACEKSYNVPALCVKLGLLAEDTEAERTAAFSSKRSYVRPMLRDMNEADLLRVAELTLEEVDHHKLEVLVAEMTKHSDHRVSTLVRKDVLSTLTGTGPLFGEQSIIGTLETVFGVQAMAAANQDVRLGLRSDGPIVQWYIKNSDWSHQEMLEHCGALTCPQTTFFKLIEAILHPMSRRDPEQSQLAQAMSQYLRRDGFAVKATSWQSGYPIYGVVKATEGVQGAAKNLIFASIGPKPELVMRDAINNDVEITKHADKVLVFDQPIPGMLSWAHLQAWWAEKEHLNDAHEAKASLYRRLLQCVRQTNSPGEQAVFQTYYKQFGKLSPERLPALLPQVYLHYDPYTQRERGQEQVLVRQRMDFLLLLQDRVRIVIEVDGQQHYGVQVGNQYRASPRLYASMAAEDRRLRLEGYEVYRFGGQEFSGFDPSGEPEDENSAQLVVDFFSRLFKRHGLKSGTDLATRSPTVRR